jgi:hypothetical protein
MMFTCIAPATNTSSTVTLNVNSVGAVTVVKDNNSSLDLGDIVGGAAVSFFYDGSNFHLLAHRATKVTSGNRLINGDMAVDQRDSFTTPINIGTSNLYSVDRWFVGSGSAPSGTLTAARAPASPSGPGNGAGIGFNALRILRSSGSYSGFLYAAQQIESINCIDLAGLPVTLSFRARRGTAFGSTGNALSASIRVGTGINEANSGLSGGTWTGYSQVVGNTFTLSTAWERFSVTTPAVVPISTMEMGVLFSTATYTGSGGANDWCEITDVQLEVGQSANDFERLNFAESLALCERYYERGFAGSNQFRVYGTGTSEIYYFGVRYRTAKRISTTPTISGIAYANAGSANLGGFGQDGFNISYAGTGGAGQHGIAFDWQMGAEL